jgi:hypothetical protein
MGFFSEDFAFWSCLTNHDNLSKLFDMTSLMTFVTFLSLIGLLISMAILSMDMRRFALQAAIWEKGH